ncbi:hypothetical protein [Pseudomonas sp.]|uniref:hypothetical protein n=1 Tax=Pseudomonas sp. TaxID=306 RepID=UPI0028A93056|nr:hypothetical protein [Pseudomonas sp.]
MDSFKFRVLSLYWNNVSPDLVSAQSRVFNFFGYPIEQQNLHGVDHGAWMEKVLNSAADDEVVVIVDIDCIPLSAEAIGRAVRVAQDGAIFGCAQSANHIDHRFIYAAPMFLALTGRTWRLLDTPSLKANEQYDVAGRLSAVARQRGVLVELAYPTCAAVPRWLLGDTSTYGLFTIFEGQYLHLFESRNTALVHSFVDLANSLVAEGELFDYRPFVLRCSQESHEQYAKKYFLKHSFSGKLKREWARLKRRVGC